MRERARGRAKSECLRPSPRGATFSATHQAHHPHDRVAHGHDFPDGQASRQGAAPQQAAQQGFRAKQAGRAADRAVVFAVPNEAVHQAGGGGDGGAGLRYQGVQEGHGGGVPARELTHLGQSRPAETEINE